MKNLLKQLLFGKARSPLNLLIVLPVLVCFTLGCICSGSPDYRGCVTADGETLVLGDAKVRFIKLADGTVAETRPVRNSALLCASADDGGGGGGEVVAIDQQVKDKKRDYDERTAHWLNKQKTYRLAPDEFFEKYTGFIQDRYFVSSSRGYVMKSRTEGSGKNSRTVHYKVYTQPQVFTLEDSSEGTVKSHHVSREKLGLPESVYYDDLRFYPLGLSPQGAQLFGLLNNGERSLSVYRLDVFTGALSQNSGKTLIPGKESFENFAFDKGGRYAVYVQLKMNSKGTIVKTVKVLRLETGAEIFSKELAEVSYDHDTPKFFFDENGGEKLIILVEGFRFDPQTRIIKEVTVFDLENARETANFDLRQIFGDPESVDPIFFKDDDFLVAHTHKPPRTVFERKRFVSRLDAETGRIVWNVELTAD